MAVVRYAAVFLVTLVLGLAVAVVVGSLGLVVPGYWILPITFLAAGAFSALVAAWVANLISWGRSRTRLGWVLLGTEATALVVLGLFVAAGVLGLTGTLSLFVELLASMTVVAANATVLSWRLRETGGSSRGDTLLTAAVAAAALLAPIALIVFVCPLIGCSG